MVENQDTDAFDRAMIRNCLPETWTHVHNLNLLQIGFAAKLAGLNWKSLPELFATLEKSGMIQRDGYTLRRSP